MRTGIAVIGANYGDEGKGLITDYLASSLAEDCVVVRYNGGAQAGHTVVAPDGRRHVFSHFGAGSFSGCPTHLSQFFIVNPRVFVKELQELNALRVSPKVCIDARAFLTTPLDVLINQVIEIQRGRARHGSCGLGINETVTRCLCAPRFATRAIDLMDLPFLHDRLYCLLKEWVPVRLKQLSLDVNHPGLDMMLRNFDDVLCLFIEDCKSVVKNASIARMSPDSRHLVFEGAQGLLLDEDRLDQFPHVTRSKTGLENVAFLCHQFKVESLDVYYVTRTYLTRHGAGPLPGECNRSFEDTTNTTNQYQGSLRFAELDMQNLAHSIDLDWRRGKYLFGNLKGGLAVTCVDQEPMADFASLSLPVRLSSYGPSRNDVHRCLSKNRKTHGLRALTVC